MDDLHGGEAVIDKIEDLIEASYRKNVFGHNRNVAQNKLTAALGQQLTQYHQIAYARRSNQLYPEKIDYHVAIDSGSNDFIKVLELASYLRLLARQIDENNVV
jgi:hypothetical protein